MAELDRQVDGEQPPYCVHGYTRCVKCQHWCWLGDKTHEVVASGRATPLCLTCANGLNIPASAAIRIGNATDHRPEDGPHVPPLHP